MNNRGVTLVELMSCVAILSVLTVFAVPNFSDWATKANLNSSVAELVSNLHQAKIKAIMENSFVVFTYEEDSYEGFSDNGVGGGKKGDWVRQETEPVLFSFKLPDTIRIDTALSTFTSSRTRFGRTPGMKAGSVVLVANNGRRERVIVNILGRIRIEQL